MSKTIVAALSAALLAAPAANAASVIAPVSAVVERGGSVGELYAIENIFDQSGLSEGYEAGVTDFDEFMASGPLHSASGSGREWFSAAGETSARVVFDLGAAYTLTSLALWNEEAGGVGRLRVLTLDGLFADVTPRDNPSGIRFYEGERFDFAPVTTRYVVFEMSGCPQGDGAYAGCSLGEVAFGGFAAVAGPVPEPATWAMMILGFALTGALVRRRRGLADMGSATHELRSNVRSEPYV